MAKKRDAIDTSGARPLTHTPFAALCPPPAVKAPPPAPSGPAPGPLRFPDKIVVRREAKGRRGKTVTRIRGVPAQHREALADRMKRALGCGAIVEDDDVVLLGSLVDRAADWLSDAGASRVVRSP